MFLGRRGGGGNISLTFFSREEGQILTDIFLVRGREEFKSQTCLYPKALSRLFREMKAKERHGLTITRELAERTRKEGKNGFTFSV